MLDISEVCKMWAKATPRIVAFDTETTGLNIVTDKPFVYQFGFVDEATKIGYTYAADIETYPAVSRSFIQQCNRLATQTLQYIGHNVKFDLHMLTNIKEPYAKENVTDSMFYIRFAHDALTTEYGGPPLGLKDYTSRYITRDAKRHEAVLEAEQSLIAHNYNTTLIKLLNNAGGSYNHKKLEDFFKKDATSEYTDLPQKQQEAYMTWLNDLPIRLQQDINKIVLPSDIRYNTLNRANIMKYAHFDIVYTLEIFFSLDPIVKTRQNEIGLNIENSLVFPFLEMERVGFLVDKDYLMQAKDKMRAYILDLREELFELTDRKFKVSQHKVVKEILSKVTGKQLESSAKDVLINLKIDLEIHEPDSLAIPIITVVNELRTLEKWYSTYIIRFIKNLAQSDRLYTQISQVGTVSGRVSSDFQQFPRNGILTRHDEVLFSPRDLIKAPGGAYNGLVYLDYSQIELRFQAIYTILVGEPDLNMCRAYMPYKCHIGPLQFDCHNLEHIKHAYDWTWYFDERPEDQWTPTDIHGVMTETAFDVHPGDPTFSELRYLGKRINFAKNYGAQLKTIWAINPKWPEEQARKVNAAYAIAFPGVKKYQDYCYDLANASSWASNLFGVRYYNVTGHKLINILIQGSAAYFLKLKIREIYDYSHSIKLKSKFQMNIHDELSWERHKTDSRVFSMLQHIMEYWEDTLVPIVADMEMSTTTWGQKEGVEEIL